MTALIAPGNLIKHPSAHLSPNQCLCARALLNPPHANIILYPSTIRYSSPGISSDKSDCRAYHALLCAVYQFRPSYSFFFFYLTICASDPLQYRFAHAKLPGINICKAAHQAPLMTYRKLLSQSSSFGGFRQALCASSAENAFCVRALRCKCLPQTHPRDRHTAGAYAPVPHPTAPRSLEPCAQNTEPVGLREILLAVIVHLRNHFRRIVTLIITPQLQCQVPEPLCIRMHQTHIILHCRNRCLSCNCCHLPRSGCGKLRALGSCKISAPDLSLHGRHTPSAPVG